MSHPDDRPSRPISEKKLAANRANARKSTGPRTARGKARVSLNALTHAVTARGAVLPFENEDHFFKFADLLRAALEPRGFLQTLMAERLVELAWKLRRAVKALGNHADRRTDKFLDDAIEMRKSGDWTGPVPKLTGAQMLVDGVEGDKEAVPMLRLDLYADRLQRAFELGLSALRREQKRRGQNAGETPEERAFTLVEVLLERDPVENAAFLSKPTAATSEATTLEELIGSGIGPCNQPGPAAAGDPQNAPSQNKPTAVSGDAQPRGTDGEVVPGLN